MEILFSRALYASMRYRWATIWGVFTLSLFYCITDPADARLARCFTTDSGFYDCQFVTTDRQGSFRISASGKPTITLNIDQPGIAFGFAKFGTRNMSLPGRYLRSATDPACWVNDATGTRVCAW
jgi:hypothetical protein